MDRIKAWWAHRKTWQKIALLAGSAVIHLAVLWPLLWWLSD
jgi:hypothetical protein